jgi:hypothetical protein
MRWTGGLLLDCPRRLLRWCTAHRLLSPKHASPVRIRPSYLTVDCASKRNFALFRSNSDYIGLAGAVSMTTVRGSLGTYQAGNLFLFPFLKAKGRALGAGRVWDALVPLDATRVVRSSPIPDERLPRDEYFCRIRLQAPVAAFIGFEVDVPFSLDDVRLGYHSNVKALADGKPVGIMWASSNLNQLWFGGSRSIPGAAACNGAAWRNLIAAGLSSAAAATC